MRQRCPEPAQSPPPQPRRPSQSPQHFPEPPQAPPAPPGRHTPGSLRAALGLFTIIPARAVPQLRRPETVRAIRWLPVTGLLVAVPAAGVLLAAESGGHGGTRALLAAVLAVAVLALLTGGLHLDGLADTADGLGSRRPAAEALAIMRRPDIGPFGVTALVLTVLVQVTALAVITPRAVAAVALVTAVVTGRVAVLLATGPGSPPARPDGLGALAAAATTATGRAAAAVALLAAAGAAAAGLGGVSLAWRGLGAVIAALAVADLLRRAARRRLGGMTGDVFGAQIELSTATVLLVLALTA